MDADICNCCGEIWNRDNLKPILIGSTNIFLCPECIKDFNDDYVRRSKIDKTIKKIEQTTNTYQGFLMHEGTKETILKILKEILGE